MKRTVYKLADTPLGRHMRIALVSDLHAGAPDATVRALRYLAPQMILLAGDILESLDGTRDAVNKRAFDVFKSCAEIAPTFYCTGNHEDGGVRSQSRKWRRGEGKKREYTRESIDAIRASGVTLLLDSYVEHGGIAIGGLCSGLILKGGEPDLEFLRSFSRLDCPKLLICHHPEYYPKYIKDLPVDIIVSGHAHGGQWRIFGRGVYAPGQGLFPKYTSGVHDGRLVISRGLKKGIIPRFFNRKEIVIIET